MATSTTDGITVRINQITYAYAKTISDRKTTYGVVYHVAHTKTAVHNHRSGMVELTIPPMLYDLLCSSAEQTCMSIEELITYRINQAGAD